MIFMTKKLVFISLLLVFPRIFALPCSVSKQHLVADKKAYTKYLDALCWKISYTPSWLRDGVIKGMGLSQEECDAIPASYPFLCDEWYMRVMVQFTTDELVAMINELLQMYHDSFVSGNFRAKEKHLHGIVHKFNCLILELPDSTTTKKLAQLVEAKKIDLGLLCKAQLAGFYLKFLLENE